MFFPFRRRTRLRPNRKGSRSADGFFGGDLGAGGIPTRSRSCWFRESERDGGRNPLYLIFALRGFRACLDYPEVLVLECCFPYTWFFRAYPTGPGFDTIPRIGSQRQMSHTSREELDQRQREAPDLGRKIVGVAALPSRTV